MGIPKFFRWLGRRYPMIMTDVNSESDVPPMDHLYLDLNGVIHSSIHGNDISKLEKTSRAGLENFDAVWGEIFKYIDDIVHIIKPQQLLFMAIDGVAPRAKMNQQRTRRFRTDKERREMKDISIEGLQEEDENLELFDTNAISPGTEFMFALNKKLDYFIQYKQNSDPLYKNIKVILSGSDVPGEGEHKIMEYIRWYQNEDPQYNPQTRHCMYGQDADLIMLSLLSHEPNFTIIREEVKYRHESVEGLTRTEFIQTNNFQLMYINVLREYFELEFKEATKHIEGFNFNVDRIIDDIIFLCFFVGNDFLPSLSVLDIAEASIDEIFNIYKYKVLPELKDYITKDGLIFWDKAKVIISEFAKHELSVLNKRMEGIMDLKKKADQIKQDIDNGAELANDRMQYFALRAKQQKNVEDKKATLVERLRKYKLEGYYSWCKTQEGPSTHLDMLLSQLKDRKDAEEEVRARETITTGNQGKFDSFVDEKSEKKRIDGVVKSELKEQFGAFTLNEEYKAAEEEVKLTEQDIDDGDISDVDLEDLRQVEREVGGTISSEMLVQMKIAEDSQKKDKDFTEELLKRYTEDPDAAKGFYYQQKMGMEVDTTKGAGERDQMLRDYLTGMQWVLFYYYRGVQHWGFYYPYHYPPMISDIVDLEKLVPQTITEFNYTGTENKPFAPFMQLLTILPKASIRRLLPKDLYKFVENKDFTDYFPDDFEMDLNGRTTPWEAITLIPFVDEKKFVEFEKELTAKGELSLTEDEKIRNSKGMTKEYIWSEEEQKQDPSEEFKSVEFEFENHCERKEVDYFTRDDLVFAEITEDKVVVADFPKLGQFNFKRVDLENIKRFGTAFIIPKLVVDRPPVSHAFLDSFAQRFLSGASDSVFIGYPFQQEAFPVAVMTKDVMINIFEAFMTGQQKPQEVETSRQYWNQAQRMIKTWSQKRNLKMINTPDGDQCEVIVVCQKMTGLVKNPQTKALEKKYDESKLLFFPFEYVNLQRDSSHFQHVDTSSNSLLSKDQSVMLLSQRDYGLVGKVNEESKTGKYDLTVEPRDVESLTFAHQIYNTMNADGRGFFSPQFIQKKYHKHQIAINRVTSSIVIKYLDGSSIPKKLDIGLKIRHAGKKMHIPKHVRYTEEPNEREPDRPYTRWEYSLKATEVIVDFLTTFPFIEEYLIWEQQQEKQQKKQGAANRGQQASKNNWLEDLLPFEEKAEARVAKLKEVEAWIANCEFAEEKFVPAGFTFMDQDIIEACDVKLNELKASSKNQEKKEVKDVPVGQIFVERTPFWTGPEKNGMYDFDYGHRVVNVNTSRRNFVEFGAIGTVIGFMNKEVVVLFDEQNLSLSNVYDHAKDYRGAQLSPDSLVNLTKHHLEHKKKKPARNMRKGAQTFKPKGGKPKGEEFKGW